LTFLHRRRGAVAALLAAALAIPAQPGRAATPYEAQIGGFVAATIQALITGEFAGRSPSQVGGLRPVCKPADYDDLRAAASNSTAFYKFQQRCKFTDDRIDATHVHSIAYLPMGYCATLKAAFETFMAEQIYMTPPGLGSWSDWVSFEYKGSRYGASSRYLARGANLHATCDADGSLHLSAPRARGARRA
jgi:hypothetical protein